MTVSIADVRQANPMWFDKRTVRFMGDINHRILHDKQRQPYLVRLTYAWTDMFGGERIAHWVINPIGANLEILPTHLLERFATLADVKKALSKSIVTRKGE